MRVRGTMHASLDAVTGILPPRDRLTDVGKLAQSLANTRRKAIARNPAHNRAVPKTVASTPI